MKRQRAANSGISSNKRALTVLALLICWLISAQSPSASGDDKAGTKAKRPRTDLVRSGDLSSNDAAAEDSRIVKRINASIADKWKEHKLTPSPRASDNQFIRRASLDIIGRIATPKEIR